MKTLAELLIAAEAATNHASIFAVVKKLAELRMIDDRAAWKIKHDAEVKAAKAKAPAAEAKAKTA